MNREIKFKGKSSETSGWCDAGIWVTGNFVEWYFDAAYKKGNPKTPTIFFIKNGTQHRTAVHRESVGQFIGLLGKNGVEVYENDFVKATDKKSRLITRGLVEYDSTICKFMLKNSDGGYDFLQFYESHDIEVIGNRFEAAEMSA